MNKELEARVGRSEVYPPILEDARERVHRYKGLSATEREEIANDLAWRSTLCQFYQGLVAEASELPPLTVIGLISEAQILEQLLALSPEDKEQLDAGLDNRGMEGALLERCYLPEIPEDSPLAVAIRQARELMNACTAFTEAYYEESQSKDGEDDEYEG